VTGKDPPLNTAFKMYFCVWQRPKTVATCKRRYSLNNQNFRCASDSVNSFI
jgi:hypothetical protein